MKGSFGGRIFNIVNAVALVVIGIITVFPLYYVFIISFTDPYEYLQKSGFVLFPQSWSLGSYRYLLDTDTFKNATLVSTFLATVGTGLSLIFTSAMAFGISRKRLRGRRILMLMILLTILFNPGIIPNYIVVRDLGMINSVWSLIIPVLISGWNAILMKSFFDSIPVELEDAAMIDGCNDIGTFFRIVLPLSAPALAAFGLFYSVGYWNTFFNAILFINDYTKVPLQVVLRTMLIDSETSTGGASAAEMVSENQLPKQTIKMAAVVIATVPILAVYPFLQKHFAKGVMLGSVKG
ncbi:carbohydrate ABC transporter permease [Paenibacillus sp. FSL H7-0331]|uniref:carbohydrate ABC transporter permease n=1 Tax=Paenibacillus sp. FSL H7-0331 TaxID=1920421 RepID=UPI00096EB4E1|nr:carbohydrate ABC transporter permease [Paenibacillus sp. FSL H7-0331]OMF16073.1 ABC transporter permease [Paenibacillus sp. FSL H7-0331]